MGRLLQPPHQPVRLPERDGVRHLGVHHARSPPYFALRGNRFDRRPVAAVYGLLAGLTGAGGQLLLFQALSNGPAYLIFPLVSLSPVITVLMAVALLRERIQRLAVIGVVAALAAIVLFSISGGDGDAD